MNANNLNKLNDLIADVFEVERGSITSETRFIEDLDSSSMKRMVIIAELEELCGVTLSAAKIKFMTTVNELYEALTDWLQ